MTVTRTTGGRAGFTELVAWQKAYSLAVSVYQSTVDFPDKERFGLTQQIRRAGVSVPSNIAEGWGRSTRVDYLRFLAMARGSMYELQTQVWIAADLGYLPPNHEVYEQINEVERLLNGLIRSLRTDPDNKKC